jgi:hypothetical protein
MKKLFFYLCCCAALGAHWIANFIEAATAWWASENGLTEELKNQKYKW